MPLRIQLKGSFAVSLRGEQRPGMSIGNEKRRCISSSDLVGSIWILLTENLPKLATLRDRPPRRRFVTMRTSLLSVKFWGSDPVRECRHGQNITRHGSKIYERERRRKPNEELLILKV